MPKSSAHVPLTPASGTDRPADLIDAFLAQMAETGPPGASARTVAARIGASPSAINYHFGSIEHLYGSAQLHALNLAATWLDARLNEIAPCAPWPPSAFAAFAANLLHLWSSEQRPIAQAEASALSAAVWNPDEAAPAWLRLWESVWRRAFDLFRLDPEHAPIATAMLQSERLGHLAQWRPVFDRAGLEEVCHRLVARITSDPALLARPAPWRERAEMMSQRAVSLPFLSGAAARIADAVVAAVDEGGESALTHRAAALKAGVSLGAVTHHFPTRSGLMGAGYSSLYLGLVDAANRAVAPGEANGDIGHHILSLLNAGRAAPRARALEAFFYAATREPALADFAARVRYSRGSNTLRLLLPRAAHLTRLDGLLISHWASGAGRTAVAAPDQAHIVEDLITRHAQAIFSL